MKNWKKGTALLGSVVTLSMLFGCSGSENGENSEVTKENVSTGSTLTFWHYYGDFVENQLQEIVDDFHETVGKEENITVKLVGKSSIAQLEVAITESAQGVVYAEELPDLFLAYPDKVLELQKQGVVADLDLYFSQEDWANLIDTFVRSGEVDGMQAILPTVKSTELMFINETLWEEFSGEMGYTYEDLTTWEGVFHTSKAYYEYTDAKTPNIDQDGKAFFGFDSLQNFILVSCMQQGVDLFHSETSQREDVVDILKEIFRFYVDGMSCGYFDAVGKFRTDDIRSGDILAYVGSSASYTYFPTWIETDQGDALNISWKALPYPVYEEGEPAVLSQGAGVVITKQDGVKEETATTFLKFFLQYNVDFAMDSGYIPVVKEFLGDGTTLNTEILDSKNLPENVEVGYRLVMEQIEEDLLFQTNPQDGSYLVRSELALALEQAGRTGREVVKNKLSQGFTLEEAMDDSDFESQFQQIIQSLEVKLESLDFAQE